MEYIFVEAKQATFAKKLERIQRAGICGWSAVVGKRRSEFVHVWVEARREDWR